MRAARHGGGSLEGFRGGGFTRPALPLGLRVQQYRDLNEFGEALGAMEARARDLAPVLRAGRVMAVSEVEQRFSEAKGPDGKAWPPLRHPRAQGGDKPLLNTGLMRASVTGSEGADWIKVGLAHPAAAQHHFGGTVAPKNKKYLSIPLTPAAARAGSPRRFPEELSPRIGPRGGVLVDGKGVAHFALTRGPVRVPPRPAVGFSAEWVRKFGLMLGEHVAVGVVRVEGGQR